MLIEGPSGAGKSDLALRLLAAGWRLVADDRVLLWRSGRALYGRAPDALRGLLEARGLGVVGAPSLPFAAVALAVAHADAPERMPEPAWRTLAGVAVPTLALDLLAGSTPAKLGLALTLQGDAGSQLGPRRA